MARPNNTPLNHPRVRWSRLKIYWPVLVWVAAVAGFVVIVMRDLHGPMFMGVAENQRYDVHAAESLPVRRVLKQKGDVVAHDDVLIELDDTGLSSERAAIIHEIIKERREREEDRQRIIHELWLVLHETQRRMQELAVETAVLTAEQPLLFDEKARVAPLVEQRLLTPDVLVELEIRIASIHAHGETHPGLRSTLEQTLAWTREQLAILEAKPAPEPAPEEHPAVRGLDWRIANTRLRAHGSGHITEVYARPGTMPVNDPPLMRISRAASRRIIGFIPEINVHAISTGMVFHVQSIASDSLIGSATVVTLMPEIVELPQESMLLASRLVRGRYAVLEMNEEIDLIPGQLVTLLSHANAREKWNAFRERLRGRR
jgi:multidrug resistance efflux pump